MKPRRAIITLECTTTYTVAEIRAALTHLALSHGRWITRYPDDHSDGMPNRIDQVQVNAIRETKQPRSQRARMAKFAKEDAERADPKRPGWFSDRIDEVLRKPERKAKRAKGGK